MSDSSNPNPSRLQRLRVAMTEYGRVSGQLRREIRALGNAILEALPAYLGDNAVVYGVPPYGEWEPDQHFDQAFSDFGRRGFLEVGAVDMGLAFGLPHIRDDGVHWTRIVIELEPSNGLINVGPKGGGRLAAKAGTTEAELEPVCELIFEYLLGIFADPARMATEQGKGVIGFWAPSS